MKLMKKMLNNDVIALKTLFYPMNMNGFAFQVDII